MSVKTIGRKTHKNLYDRILKLSRFIDIASFLNSKKVPCMASFDECSYAIDIIKFVQKHKDKKLTVISFQSVEYIFIGDAKHVLSLLLKEFEEIEKQVD